MSWETAEEIAALNARAIIQPKVATQAADQLETAARIKEAVQTKETKSVETKSQETDLSIQARSKGGDDHGSLLYVMARAGEIIPPWWSAARDMELRSFWKGVDHFSGAMYSIEAKLESVPFRIEPRDTTVQRHWKQAEEYEIRLVERAEYGQGWGQFFSKWLVAFWSCDNGAFAEIIGAGPKDGPIKGAPVGIANLDSCLCQRTSDPEYPVLYRDTDSKIYKLHRTRVIFASQLPSSDARMKSVGFCWLSRCISIAQGLSDVLQYKQEKIGSRPNRAIIYGSGVDTDLLTRAVNMANEDADNAGFSRYSMTPVIATKSTVTPLSLDILDLASLPDGFDYSDDVTLGMYTIALAGGFPPRWLWPATAVGATKADALLQHTAMSVSGASQALTTVRRLLAGSNKGKRHMVGKFLPPQLKMIFDFQDDEQDRLQADIKDKRSMTNERDLGSGVITIQAARQRMLADGDITETQLEDMELEDGRMPDGRDATDILYSDSVYISGIDPDNPDLVLADQKLREAKRVAATATNPTQRREARMALAALEVLFEPSGDGEPLGDREEPEDDEEDREEEQKARNEKPFASAIEDTFDDFEDETITAIEQESEPDYALLAAALLAIIVPILASAATRRVDELVIEHNIGIDPAETYVFAMEWARNYSFELVSGITDTTRNVVQSALRQYIDTPGMTTAQLEALLEPAFGAARARLIAATEITRAYSQGALLYADILRGLGLEVTPIWDTILDERTCIVCGPLDGTTQDIWGGDFPGGPPAHPNGRCNLRLEVRRP